MKRVLIAVSAISMLATLPAMAQDTAASRPLTLQGSVSSGALTPTPQMWFYQQYRTDYQDPKQAVREKAEFRATQRQRRIAAKKWFGLSNHRPTCSTDPLNSDWSPRWTSNNFWYPYRWEGTGRPWVVVRPNDLGMRIY